MTVDTGKTESLLRDPGGQDPFVSICIPVFNGEKTIRKTIASIIHQSYKNIEIIIVDNCSTDSTVAIVKEFRDPRIRLIQNDVFVSCIENFNRCFQYTKGEFTAIFHADDIYLPQIVSRQIEIFKKYPAAGSVFTQGNIIDENDEIVGKFSLPPGIKGSTLYRYQDLLIASLENYNFLTCPTAMIRTDLFLKLSPFRSDPFNTASDFDMYLRASQCAPVIIIDEKLIHYRVCKDQGTYGIDLGRTHEADFFRVLDFHIAQSAPSFEIPVKSIEIYELSRFEDILMRAKNFLIKNDISGYHSLAGSISWTRYLRFTLKHPPRYRHILPKLLHLIVARVIFSLFGVSMVRKFFLDDIDRKRLFEKN